MEKTTWDLTQLYDSLEDPRIERDVRAYERATKALARELRANRTWKKSPRALARAIEKLNALDKKAYEGPLYYLFYRKDLDARDTPAKALMARLEPRYTKARNLLTFFHTELATLPKATQKVFLESRHLKPYQYLLKKVFENGIFTLSETEENILALKGEVAGSRWEAMTGEFVAKASVTIDKKQVPIPEALERVMNYPKGKRRKAWKEMVGVFKSLADVAEHELNALVTNHKIDNELRGRTSPEEATIRHYENAPRVISSLVEVVTDSYPISHKFYAIKARLLGEKTMEYVDRGVALGAPSVSLSFDSCIKRVREVFGAVHPRYADIVDRLVEQGRLDVYPKKGKTNGAYCSHGVSMPTFVLLNHVDNLRSYETLAHELGHAIHSERSKTQPPHYEGYSTATAETASTLFEQIALDALLEEVPKDEKVMILDHKLTGDTASIFRQIAAYTFEQTLHRQVAKEGYLTKDVIASMLAKELRAHLGKSVRVTDDDGYSFVYWSHFRRFFYVYTYAYGQLVSRALFERWKKNPSYVDAIDDFLVAGSSRSPEEIFTQAGLSFTRGAVFKEGLEGIGKEVALFGRLSNHYGKTS